MIAKTDAVNEGVTCEKIEFYGRSFHFHEKIDRPYTTITKICSMGPNKTKFTELILWYDTARKLGRLLWVPLFISNSYQTICRLPCKTPNILSSFFCVVVVFLVSDRDAITILN